MAQIRKPTIKNLACARFNGGHRGNWIIITHEAPHPYFFAIPLAEIDILFLNLGKQDYSS